MVNRLNHLRTLLQQQQLDAYIITSADAHQSEYVAPHWKSREWLSGFTGSAGILVITATDAGLWTDGRYYIQAEQQLTGTGITMFKMNADNVPTFYEWLTETLCENTKVGIDGRTVSVTLYEKINKEFTKKHIQLVYDIDLIDDAWPGRPALPMEPVYEHTLEFCGKSRTEKLTEVRKELKKNGAEACLISSLDDIAWLFNIRGGDVLYTPVTYAYAFISMQKAVLFIHAGKLPAALAHTLTSEDIELLPYENIYSFLQSDSLPQPVFIDENRVSIRLKGCISPDKEIVKGSEITTALKAIKCPAELAGIHNSQTRDGAAMVRFIMWLKKEVHNNSLEEADMHDMLASLRNTMPHSVCPSFYTIAGYMENAALMHYAPQKGASKKLKPEGMLLVDTGGQYLDGTTDITRTIMLGNTSYEQRYDFTYVLKAHIALSRARFLYGSSGANVDILARQPLWSVGLDYKCGTGHGVGYFLSVHEGPQGFGQTTPQVKLEPGMIITNEPGVYKEGQWGIRIENTMLVVEDETINNNRFLRFETISYCPIELNAIEKPLLTTEEINWLNAYHEAVYSNVAPLLNPEEKAWLRQATLPI